jgi:acyl-CoA reductase-like NAD-dependent aldehyde dehydrogenase
VQAIAALTAAAKVGVPVLLVSAPHAGGYVGVGWFHALVAAAREAVPVARCSVLFDCGDNTGAALAAIRAKVEGVIFTGRTDIAHRLADMARQQGLRFETERPVPALDLVEEFFASREEIERRCAEFLG